MQNITSAVPVLLDEEEIATILAALHLYQSPFRRDVVFEQIASDFGRFPGLDNDAIDRLCGRLNFPEANAVAGADVIVDCWQRNLRPGDEVTWTDPDDGICSRTGKIVAIELPSEDVAQITWDDGSETEAHFGELS